MSSTYQRSSTTFEQSTVMDFSKNKGQERVCQINQKGQLPRVDELGSEGGQTSTPARPTHEAPNMGNPQDKVQNQKESKSQPSKFKKIAIILSIILVVLLTGTTIAIIVLASRPRFQTVVIKSYVSVPMASSNQNVRTKVVSVKDPEILKSQAPVEIYASQVQKQSKTTPNRLLQQTKPLSTYTIYDKILNCGVTISSLSYQMTLVMDASKLLTFIFSSQPPVQVKEQTLTKDQNKKDKTAQIQTFTYTYPLFGEKVIKTVKDRLQKLSEKTIAAQTTNINIKYNKKINAFEVVPQVEPNQNQTAVLFEASKVKVIKNFNNEDQLTDAASQIVFTVLFKAKQFFEKRYAELKKQTGIELASNVPDFGQPSLYKNYASDYQKDCRPINNQTLKCDTSVLSYDGINLKSSDNMEQVTSDIKFLVDL